MLKRGDIVLFFDDVSPYTRGIGVAVNRNWVLILNKPDLEFQELSKIRAEFNVATKRFRDYRAGVKCITYFEKFLQDVCRHYKYKKCCDYYKIFIPRRILKLLSILLPKMVWDTVVYFKNYGFDHKFLAEFIESTVGYRIREGILPDDVTIEDYLGNSVLFHSKIVGRAK